MLIISHHKSMLSMSKNIRQTNFFKSISDQNTKGKCPIWINNYFSDIMEKLPFGTWVIVQMLNATFCGFVCYEVANDKHMISVFGRMSDGNAHSGHTYEVSMVDAYNSKVSERDAFTFLAVKEEAIVRPTWVLKMVSC